MMTTAGWREPLRLCRLVDQDKTLPSPHVGLGHARGMDGDGAINVMRRMAGTTGFEPVNFPLERRVP